MDRKYYLLQFLTNEVDQLMTFTPLEARSYYQHLINQDPQDPSGYLGMGDLAFYGGFYQEAISYFTQAINCDSQNFASWVGLTKIFLHYNSIQQAEECLIEALNVDPINHEALILATIIKIRLNEYAKGLDFLDKIGEDNESPYDSLSLYLRGYIACLLGDFEDGLEHLKSCEVLSPFNDETNSNYQILWNNLGVANFRFKRFTEAENYLQNITQKFPSCDSISWLNLAMVYWAQDKIDQSIIIFEKIQSLQPKLWPWLKETKEYRSRGQEWLHEVIQNLQTESTIYNVGLYLGCVIPNRYPFIEAATRHVFDTLNIGVVDLEGASCCPAPGVFRSFDIETWLTLGARNITISEQLQRDLVTMCNGCYGTLNDVNYELKTDSEKRTLVNDNLNKVDREFQGSINVRHIIDVLFNEIGLDALKKRITHPLSLRVAVHYGCHLLKPMKTKPWTEDWEEPTFFDDLVEITGATSVPYKEKMMCCGAGGGVRGALKEISLDFTREKLIHMRDAGIDAIVVCCPFCHLQFDIGQLEVNNIFKKQIRDPFNIPVIYITQLLGLAMGFDPFRMGLLKTPQEKGVPPMNKFELLFTKYKPLDLHNTSLFLPRT
ncbi:hypothetical protein WKT22_03418 [Candidatus Lokiarchaeum ossiferum]